MTIPPSPRKIPKKLKIHGDVRIDNYYWLRDDKRKNKEVLNYLNKENKYTNFWFKTNKVDSKKFLKVTKTLFQNLKRGLKQKLINLNIIQPLHYLMNTENIIGIIKIQKNFYLM